MNKSKFILISGLSGVIIGTFWLCGYVSKNPSDAQIYLRNDADMRTFISQHTETPTESPPTRQEITLPEDGSSKIYETYTLLQDKQHLPISDHAGQKAVLWTYTLSYCPDHRAELICTPEGLLLGAICYDCTRFDLMYPLIT